MTVRSIAIACIRRADGALLVTSATEPATGRVLVRPPGGGIEAGETAPAAAVRELREELGVELGDVTLLGVLEHRVVFAGRALHELVHICTARVVSDAVVPPQTDAGHPVWWLAPDRFDDPALEIVPSGLLGLLEAAGGREDLLRKPS